MTRPLDLGVGATVAAVCAGDVTATEVAAAFLARHTQVDPDVHALVHVDPDAVHAQAAAVDRAVAEGRDPGRLAGVTVSVKDNLDVRGEVTRAGSHGVGMVPATADATALARLRAAGAVLLGRSNMDELAMGASTQTSAYGPTYHPWDARRSPGGSSGGAAASVASRQVLLAVGTDTGGSVREPASQCGLVGLAPTPGLVPVDGVLPFDPSCDRVGPLGRTVDDVRRLLAVLSGGAAAATGRPDGAPLRVGVVRELADDTNHAGVLAVLHDVLDALRRHDAQVREVSVPHARRALACYMTVTSAAALPVLSAHVARGGAGEEVVRRLALAEQAVGDGLVAPALAERATLAHQVAAALADVDVLVSPTMPTTAPVLRYVDADELTDPLAAPYTDCWTVVASLAGLPAVSVPAGLSPDDGMPVGVMLVGRAGADGPLLEAAALVERLAA